MKNVLFILSYGLLAVPLQIDGTLKTSGVKDATTPNLELKFWGQIFPLSGYNTGDGTMKLHIQDGVAPYKLELKVNDALFRTVENIPDPQFNYATYEGENYADCNCVVSDLPTGIYGIVVWDSAVPPAEVRGGANWNTASPPYVTVGVLANTYGLNTTIGIQYGEVIPGETEPIYTHIVPMGTTNAPGVQTLTLQLSAGNYSPATGLQPGKTYNFRGMGTNVNGTVYGENMTFEIPPILPMIQTLPASGITLV